jgi:putative oxidoreductase
MLEMRPTSAKPDISAGERFMSQSPQPRLVIPSLGGIYERLSPYMEPLLRFVAGAMLIPHGCQKLFGMFGGGGLSGTAVFMEKSGYSPGMLWAIVVGCTETFGGILLAVGLLTRPAAAAITIELICAIRVTIQRGWIGTNELPVLWLVIVLVFLIRGGGRCSIDRTIGREF